MEFRLPTPLQWQLVKADLDPVEGSEQAGDRPCLIVSREEANEALPTVTVLPVTTLKPGRRPYPSEVLLPAGLAGNPNASLIMAQQVRTVDKRRFYQSYGWLRDETCQEKVRQVIRMYFDLD